MRVAVGNVGDTLTFAIGGQSITPSRLAPIGSLFEFDMPAMPPGVVNLIARSNGIDSKPVPLHVLGPDSLTQTISGQALYQKIDVNDAGLDLTHPVMVPVRNARVEVFSQTTGAVVAVTETDGRGRFSVPVPLDPALTVRVISRLRSLDLRVVDNTNQSALYVIPADVDGRAPNTGLVLKDTSPSGRVSGAFNILEMVQRANETIVLHRRHVVVRVIAGDLPARIESDADVRESGRRARRPLKILRPHPLHAHRPADRF